MPTRLICAQASSTASRSPTSYSCPDYLDSNVRTYAMTVIAFDHAYYWLCTILNGNILCTTIITTHNDNSHYARKLWIYLTLSRGLIAPAFPLSLSFSLSIHRVPSSLPAASHKSTWLFGAGHSQHSGKVDSLYLSVHGAASHHQWHNTVSLMGIKLDLHASHL